ncbi:hypothetical protein [Sphingobium sp. WCS2017Hpa-17]|uniref:hypothetical protein n=1 Tax=Sphingobium sp. WCS2017Hpa-17 TaxID=3073638 RepID=UPI00288997A5|nr:hypothetical protein [Sphingobium sp. WCS2017Hpa-17]
MGSHIRPLLFAAPLMLAAPVHAQQADTPAGGFQLPPTGSAPAPDPNRQGPELNVYRDPVIPRATPPVVAPTVTPPPATVQPTPVPQTSRPRPTQATPPAEPRPTRPAERSTPTPPAQTRPAPVTPAPAEPAPIEADNAAANSSTPVAPPAQPLPAPAANAVDSPEPAPATTSAPAEEGISLPWIIAAIVAALVVLAGLILLRRRPPALRDEAPTPARTPTPVAKPKAAVPPPPAPDPAETLHVPAAVPAAATDRPWIDMDMAVGQARYSLMGVTISYALILHNRGDRPAQDVLIRGMLGNGGAQQQAVLQGFFTGQDGLPLHSAVAIQPGETIQLSGELRLSTDEIVPVEMGQRSLLIPLAAFDAAYRWDAEAGQPVGQGRTARAFIVGQEQEPPAARLAPLRLDQGPRQYRRPAARAAAELTPA